MKAKVPDRTIYLWLCSYYTDNILICVLCLVTQYLCVECIIFYLEVYLPKLYRVFQ